jgi:hypothetical protein
MPISRITVIAPGSSFPDGSLPALKTSRRSPAFARTQPSAIWERAELPVQRIKTRFLSVIHGSNGSITEAIDSIRRFHIHSRQKSGRSANRGRRTGVVALIVTWKSEPTLFLFDLIEKTMSDLADEQPPEKSETTD